MIDHSFIHDCAGCPQLCAKKGGYGAYLMLEPTLVYEIVQTLHTQLTVPVTCKIRLYCEHEGGVARTIKFAQGLKDHGCQLLTVCSVSSLFPFVSASASASASTSFFYSLSSFLSLFLF